MSTCVSIVDSVNSFICQLKENRHVLIKSFIREF